MDGWTIASVIIAFGALVVVIASFILQKFKYHAELKSSIKVNETNIKNFDIRFDDLCKRVDGVCKEVKKTPDLREEVRDKFDSRMDEVEKSLTSIETKIEPFWNLVRTDIAGLLHKPTHEEMDNLIEKFQRNELNNEEAIKLFKLLWEENNGNVDRHIATLLVTTMLKSEYDIPEEVVLNVGFYSESFESNSRCKIESERDGFSAGS